jgi:outer membrane protein assembly factor BamD
MEGFPRKMRPILIAILGVSLAGLACTGASAQKKVHVTKVKPKPGDKTAKANESAEPDKVLYDRALTSLKHSKYIEARLDLQTLINTYPDSEYLAKAKLATADSYYKEGGTSNLTQSVEEYKNFIVFFPFLDEAAYAQMQVGMAHYRMMEKSDRDNSHALSAEDEFRTFLLKYPQSPLVPHAEQYLRDTQEVLADGEFRIARFYYVKQDYRASAARLVELSGRYPLYSDSDLALAMLGDIYIRAKQASKNEDDKNHWADLAGECYSRILRDYPLSRLAPEARERLKSMGMPIAKPDPTALARMKKQQEFEKQHHPNVVTKLPMGIIRSSPDLHLAAKSGRPNLNPPDATVSATEVLNQGAAGPSFAAFALAPSSAKSSATDNTESVETSSTPPATSDQPSDATTPQAPAVADPASATPPTASDTSATPSSTTPASTSPATADPPAADSQSALAPASANSQASGQTSSQPASAKDDPKNESSSKKKKGLRRLIP